MDTFAGPVAGNDYPRNLQEFDRWFANEAACRSYVFRVRWPEGYQCSRCRGKAPPWITSRGYLHCRECGGEISITAGTVFEYTRKPLRVWFQAMWLVTSQKHGASALGLQRVLGLSSYQTAWTWLHKLRRAMIRPGCERLHGSVEVDETYVGGPEIGRVARVFRHGRVAQVFRHGGIDDWTKSMSKDASMNNVHNSHCGSLSNRLVSQGICGTCSCAAPKIVHHRVPLMLDHSIPHL